MAHRTLIADDLKAASAVFQRVEPRPDTCALCQSKTHPRSWQSFVRSTTVFPYTSHNFVASLVPVHNFPSLHCPFSTASTSITLQPTSPIKTLHLHSPFDKRNNADAPFNIQKWQFYNHETYLQMITSNYLLVFSRL